ncbi:hypothetical protein FJT64_027302 [Amphibalanus amphitrite]|uniref:Uncharacterized protein n=1 Tax=Amphibalanus amphitrite TaxID=1232801 RepID=A0A6A4W0X1_AMPAM|nr:hypothetical protein FJT64_027302 [Amphibalanus amphitrite]
MAVLEFVQTCVEKGVLPCYFWMEINLLGSLTAEERAEMAESLRNMRSMLVPVLNLYIHQAVLGISVTPGQNPNIYSTLTDVDCLAIACASFSKFCADRLHRAAYEHYREAALLEHSLGVSRLPLAAQLHLVSVTRRPLPDGSAHLIHAIASLPPGAGAIFPLHHVLGADGGEFWGLELTWFFQEGIRQQAVPYLTQLEAALEVQYRLPPEARVADLPAELIRPLRLLTAQQLCGLYVRRPRLLLTLLGLEQHRVIPHNMA